MGVTVLLPVWRCEPEVLGRAFGCIGAQSYDELEILVLLNGSDAATRAAAIRLCDGESRARVIELERANLAAALNVGLEQARHELVARMDADDVCAPERIGLQFAAMEGRLEVAAIGTGYEIVGEDGEKVGVVTAPVDAGEARWRLLVSNPFAHGSMMLRRSAVLEAGGYDESFERSQDYELWVRLSVEMGLEVCAIPEVLYSLTRTDRAFGATEAQGEAAARVMARAWGGLERGVMDERVLGSMIEREDVSGAILAAAERLAADGPTVLGVAGWLFGQWVNPGSHVKAFDVARGARVREVGRAMRSAGVERVWVWGAGRHTGWLMEHLDDLGVEIAGIVDDCLAGQARFGFVVESPGVLAGGDEVLLSSDWHEDAMWDSSSGARDRGVRVWRVYGEVMCSDGCSLRV
jgi:glycosyl transferase family 2